MTDDDAERIEANHQTQRAQLVPRTVVLPPGTLAPSPADAGSCLCEHPAAAHWIVFDASGCEAGCDCDGYQPVGVTPPVRAEYENALAPKDMDPEERWYALHDGWVGEH